jgi:cytochrome P450
MATHPDFVARARKELDAVCGDAGRLPCFEDQALLPLVTATIKETLRWKPFVESGLHFSNSNSLLIGVVRVLIKDDHFENYYFPAGTRFSIPLQFKRWTDIQHGVQCQFPWIPWSILIQNDFTQNAS